MSITLLYFEFKVLLDSVVLEGTIGAIISADC